MPACSDFTSSVHKVVVWEVVPTSCNIEGRNCSWHRPLPRPLLRIDPPLRVDPSRLQHLLNSWWHSWLPRPHGVLRVRTKESKCDWFTVKSIWLGRVKKGSRTSNSSPDFFPRPPFSSEVTAREGSQWKNSALSRRRRRRHSRQTAVSASLNRQKRASSELLLRHRCPCGFALCSFVVKAKVFQSVVF